MPFIPDKQQLTAKSGFIPDIQPVSSFVPDRIQAGASFRGAGFTGGWKPKAGIVDVPGIAGRGLVRAELGVAKGVLGTLDAMLNIPKERLSKLGGSFGGGFEISDEEQLKRTAPIREARRRVISAQERFDVQYSGGLAWGTRVVAEAIPYMANAMAAGVVAGPIGAATVGFIIEGDNAYDEAIASGATEAQANTERVIVGSINAGIEALQIGRLLQFSQSGKHSLKAFIKVAREKGIKAAGGELKRFTAGVLRLSIENAIEEFVQEGVSMGTPAILRGEYPKKADGSPDYWSIANRLGEATAGGALAGPILGIAGQAVAGKRATQAPVEAAVEAPATAINVYKTTSDSRTGITEEELVFDKEAGKLTDSQTGEDVVLDQEASGSARADMQKPETQPTPAPVVSDPRFTVSSVDQVYADEPATVNHIEQRRQQQVQNLESEGVARKDAEAMTVTPDEIKVEARKLKDQEKQAKAMRKKEIKHAGPVGQIRSRLDTIKAKSPSRNARRRQRRVTSWLTDTRDKLSSYVDGQSKLYQLARQLDGYDDSGPMTTHVIRPVRAAMSHARGMMMEGMKGIRTRTDAAGIDLTKLMARRKTNLAGGMQFTGTEMAGLHLVAQDPDGRRRLDADFGKDVVDEIITNVEQQPDLMVMRDAVREYIDSRTTEFMATAGAMEIEVTAHDMYVALLTLDLTELQDTDIGELFGAKQGRHVRNKLRVRGKEKTIKRTKTDAAVQYDLMKIMPNVIQGMEHFIAAGPATQRAGEILADPELKRRLNRATRGHGAGLFNKWLKDSALGAVDRQSSGMDKIAYDLRRNAIGFVLGHKYLSVVPKQAISSLNAISLDPRLAPGIFKRMFSYGYPGNLESDWKFASGKSELVKNRDWERDARRSFNAKGMKRFFKHKRLSPLAMRGTATVDRGTVTAVWRSKYALELARTSGDEKLAIQRADDIISQTQPMGNVEDLPHFFRGGILESMASTFMGQPNTNWNNMRHNIWGEMRAGKISKSTAFSRFLLGVVLPSQVLGLVSRGRLPREPEEMLEDLAFYTMTPWFFFGRWGYNVVKGQWDAEDAALNKMPLTGLEEASAAISDLKKGKYRGVVEHGVGAYGAVTGKVPKQIITTTGGVIDLLTEETDDLRRLYWSKNFLKYKDK